MLACLTDATSDSSFCNNLALGVFCMLPSTFARKKDTWVSRYFKTSPFRFFVEERNNMKPNKFFIKLTVIIYLSFLSSLNVALPAANIWTLLFDVDISNLVTFSVHSSINFQYFNILQMWDFFVFLSYSK